MKKIFGFAAAVLMASALFAGPFGELGKSLSALDTTQVKGVPETLAEGKDLLPIVWKYAKADGESGKGVVGFSVNIKSLDVSEKEYTFVQAVMFKFGVGLQKQESLITVKQDGKGFTVFTKAMRTGNIDGSGKYVGDPMDNPPRSWNKNSKNIAGEIARISKVITDNEYAECLEEAAVSPFVLYNVANKSALAFKKYVKDNEVVGKKATMQICVTKVDEAPKFVEGYAYFVSGKVLCGYQDPNSLNPSFPKSATVHFYTNDESVVSLTPVDFIETIKTMGEKIGSLYEVKGTISDVSRLEHEGFSSVTISVNE